jgi:hypothetical protein
MILTVALRVEAVGRKPVAFAGLEMGKAKADSLSTTLHAGPQFVYVRTYAQTAGARGLLNRTLECLQAVAMLQGRGEVAGAGDSVRLSYCRIQQ